MAPQYPTLIRTAFPTTGQPVTDTVLIEMMLSLKASLRADIMAHLPQIKGEVQELEDWVSHVEGKIEEYSASYITMVDAHAEHSEDIFLLKDKVEDVEDRSRNNNEKIMDIPESILSSQLQKYIQDLFSSLLPPMAPAELIINRIQRIPKPAYHPSNIPRDVLLRVHFFHVKGKILTTFCHSENLPEQFSQIQLLPDLLQHTLQGRRNLATVTKTLRNHKIMQPWKYLATLNIVHNGTATTVYTLEEGLQALR